MTKAVRANFLNGETIILSGCDTINDIRVRICRHRESRGEAVALPPEVAIMSFPEGTYIASDDLAAPDHVSAVFVCEERTQHLWAHAFAAYAACRDMLGVSRCVNALLEFDPHFVGKSMIEAAEAGDILVVKTLIDNATHVTEAVNMHNEEGWSPLHLAAYNGRYEIAKLLLGRDDVDATARNKEGWAPLHLAAHNCKKDIVQMLLARSDIVASVQNLDGWCASHLAAQEGAAEIMEILLAQKGVIADERSMSGYTPLHCAIFCSNHEFIRMLLSRPDVSPNAQNYFGETPLHFAAGYGKEDVVEMLLAKRHLAVNTQDEEGRTALHAAASYGKVKVVKMLLARPDILPDVPDKKGETPIQCALRNGKTTVAEVLKDLTRNYVVRWTPVGT